MPDKPNRTPLYEDHKARGGRLVNFAGWEMPVQFQGIMAEHKTVREKAGVFDISHMGQVWVSGPDAAAFLQHLLTNDLSGLVPGKGLYTLLCREDGCVVDDLYVYSIEAQKFLLIVNASRAEVDLQWIRDHVKGDVQISTPESSGAIALQGPWSQKIMEQLCPDAARLSKNEGREFPLVGGNYFISRTGYTGEDGFEVFVEGEAIAPFYQELMKVGEPLGLLPCGLGARDSLRLEMGYRLYGNDMDEQHTALEAGLSWVVKLGKDSFIGKEALEREKAKGSAQRLVAFKLKGKGVPRHGLSILLDGQVIGTVTSGGFSPSLGLGLGLGYVDNLKLPKSAEPAEGLAVKIYDREIPAETAKLPFYIKAAPATA